MMNISRKLSLPLASLLLSQSSHADLFPDGDFANGIGTWVEVAQGGTFIFSSPSLITVLPTAALGAGSQTMSLLST